MNKADTSSSTVVIAIDGPAASGKSTVARALAAQLGYRFLNSGDLYRAITWNCLSQDVDCRDIGAVASAVGNSHVEIVATARITIPSWTARIPGLTCASK